ncbi:MAG: hypothetical protein KU37_07095 [Sulfuricurvum sp. PC08-66]|nr:MAG: hypothetical protein KU37_07095 [Sulfuricurvum sp. PC08-66]
MYFGTILSKANLIVESQAIAHQLHYLQNPFLEWHMTSTLREWLIQESYPLDKQGAYDNSLVGTYALELLTTKLGRSIF